MFGFQSLEPAKLFAGTERRDPAAHRAKSAAMGETHSPQANGHAAHHGNGSVHPKSEHDPGPATMTPDREPQEPQQHEAKMTGAGTKPEPEVEQPRNEDVGHSTSTIDFSTPQAEAGPSKPRPAPTRRLPSDHSFSQDERGDPAAAADLPDESQYNAISYRRDPETVIAYLVPLPKPTVKGKQVDVPLKYFLYAPPPPHLIKPAHGGEGYVRRLNRHWQQNVRRAKRNSHDRKGAFPMRVLRAAHSRAVRAVVWVLDGLKHDDVAFLSRVHPKTVAHLILIHPWALSGTQSAQDVLGTFRAQMAESKKRAKRDSILSAVFFMPALVIDTTAVFFGGLAEIDGIWMLVSITAYRTARLITRKMGPEPKTMQIPQEKLIGNAQLIPRQPAEPEPEEEEPGALRRSVDALRRSMGSVKHRMSMNQRRSKGGKRQDGEGTASDDSQPQTNNASRSDVEGAAGTEPEHHEQGEVAAAAPRSTSGQNATSAVDRSEPELCGILEHAVAEESPADGQPGPSTSTSGGVLADTAEESRSSGESKASEGSKKQGQNFQLTFYPSPAMDTLTRYLHESCHTYNSHAFTSPTPVPTAKDVLPVIGWEPEKRQHPTPELQADDTQCQIREIEDDLNHMTAKAAKSWNNECRKYAKENRRTVGKWPKPGKKKKAQAGRRSKVRRPKAQKGKAREPDPADAEVTEDEHSATAMQRLVAARKKRRRPEKDGDANPAEKKRKGGKAGKVAILFFPCLAIGERVKRGKKDRMKAARDEETAQTEEPARSGALKRGLGTTALRQRMEARKAKKPSAEVQPDTNARAAVGGQAPDPPGQTAGVEGQTHVEDETTPKTSKRGRLLAIPAGVAAAIAGIFKKRGQGNSKATEKERTSRAKKNGRFSALRQYIRSLRSRVTKKRRPADSEDSSRERRQKTKKQKETAPTKETPRERQPRSTKEHGAIVGLAAGVIALPGVKFKEARDRRRKGNTESAMPAPDAASPVTPPVASTISAGPSSAAAEGRGTTRSLSTGGDRPDYQPPTVEQQLNEMGTARPGLTQYLPGHGQSEIPMHEPDRSRPETRMGSADTAVEETPTSVEPENHTQPVSATAATKFKSMRDGLGHLTTRKRGTGGETAATAAGGGNTASTAGESVPGGRLPIIKGGFGNLNKSSKRRGAGAQPPHTTAPDGSLMRTAPEGGPTPGESGGKFKGFKGGLGNIRGRKNEGEEPKSKEKPYKDKEPGLIERIRWILYVA